MKCAKCPTKKCYTEQKNCTKITEAEAKSLYTGDNIKIMEAAACTEARYYNNLTRLEETAKFCEQMGYKKLGMAFCIGLSKEAKFIEKYLAKSFDISSVCCKVCGVDKDRLSLEKIKENIPEAMCNPLAQAKVLQNDGAEFCISVGLCVGHDALFNSACTVPVTCLVAKDRVLAHNPLGVVYSRYWRRKLDIKADDEV